MAVPPNIKPVFWIGSAKGNLSALHEDVRDAVGQALFEAQKGGKHARTKPLRGYGDASGWKSLSIMPVTRFAPSTPSGGPAAFTSCTSSRRSRRPGLEHRRSIST